MTCQARWDFSYGGRLAGTALRSRQIAPILSAGRAWGAAVAVWHAGQGTLLAAWDAHHALLDSINQDVREMEDNGWPPNLEDVTQLKRDLGDMLEHYMTTAEPLPNLTRLEAEIQVPIPSRSGRSSSNRYRYLCRIDGYTTIDGYDWLVEFKLRGKLQPTELIQLQRQYRWYAWALSRVRLSRPPAGIIVDERWNQAPKPVRILKGPHVSHASDQLCTAEAYIAACQEYGEAKHDVTHAKLLARRWQQRVPIQFRDGELEEAGRELVSGARLIHDLDTGLLWPIRNASAMNCNGCRFRRICANPEDDLYVDTLFDRVPAKRERTNENEEPDAIAIP